MRFAASFVVVTGLLGGCATLPPAATHEGCARARLARQWHDARHEAFVGCYVDDAGAFSGTLILSAAEDAAVYDDEPRRFRLVVREAMLAGDDADDGARWELLQQDLVRLHFPAPPGRPQQRAFEAVDACVQGQPRASDGAADAVTTLHGQVAAITPQAPFLGPPSPVRLRRIPCVR
jgi:hypothetical protein